MRLDTYLATYHNVTRNRAQQLIATDLILVNHRVCNKASFQVVDSTIVTITADRRVEWVSRSAEKLAGFLEEINMQNIICKILDTNCLDIGSSTG